MTPTIPNQPYRQKTFWGVDSFLWDPVKRGASTTLFDDAVNKWLSERGPTFVLLQFQESSGSSWGQTSHLFITIILYQEDFTIPAVSDGFDNNQFK